MSDDWSKMEIINARERLAPPQRTEPAIDTTISKVVGKNIRVNDPKLVRLVAKWKMDDHKPEKETRPDNYLKNPEKIKELKQVFS